MQPAASTTSLSKENALGGANALTTRHAWMLVAALMFGGVVAIAGVVPGASSRNDFAHYFLSAKILSSGADPYCVPLEPLCEQYGFEYDQRIPYGANPPLLIRMFTLLAWMPPGLAYGVWSLVQIGVLVIFLEATRRLVRWRVDEVRFWLLAGFVLSSTTLQSHVVYSQVQLLIGAVLAVALLARSNGRHLLACGLVALAAGFKLYPAVLLPWFVLSAAPRWSDWVRRSGVVLAVLAAVVAATGPAAWISFVENGLSVIHANRSVISHTNYSIQAMIVNGLGGLFEIFLPETGGRTAASVARFVSLGLIGLAYVCVWRKRLSDFAAFSLLTITMIVCSPVAWAHYMVLMIVPAAMLFRYGNRIASPRVRSLAYLVAFLSLMPSLDGSLYGISNHPIAWAVHYYPLYALAIAAVLFVRLPESVFTEDCRDESGIPAGLGPQVNA